MMKFINTRKPKKIFFLLLIFLICSETLPLFAVSAAKESSPELRKELIDTAKKYIGSPYSYGSIGPDKFDCSGFIYSVALESVGYHLPRTVKALYSYVRIIPDDEKESGDLLFFKTTGDGTMSHAAIYIGNGQFIHAASDGPNTGVIVSSLREHYWKSKYSAAGRFLPVIKSVTKKNEELKTIPVIEKKAMVKTSRPSQGIQFLPQNFNIDANAAVDWDFFTTNRVMLNFRGLVLKLNASYIKNALRPGIAAVFRYNAGTGVFQIPVEFSLAFNEFLRVYAGPVFSFGTPFLPDTDTKISTSIFPGIMGISWQTPTFSRGLAKITFVQDLSYTVYNDDEGAALSPLNSLIAGIVFSSGIRVTLPLDKLIK